MMMMMMGDVYTKINFELCAEFFDYGLSKPWLNETRKPA